MSKFFITLLVIALGVMTNTQTMGQIVFSGGVSIGYGGCYPPPQSQCPPPHHHSGGNVYSQSWIPPICDNAGNSLGVYQARGIQPHLVSFSIDLWSIDNLASGCIVDGHYTMAGSTVNMDIQGVRRSIPISHQAHQILERGGTIQVTMIW